MAEQSSLAALLREGSGEIITAWLAHQEQDLSNRSRSLKPGELTQQSQEFLQGFVDAVQRDPSGDVRRATAWEGVRDTLGTISHARARQGFSPTETATFVFSLKRAIFEYLRGRLTGDPETLVAQILAVNAILDQLGLFTTETYQRGREEVIARQQQELMELSTPVVRLWDGVLALPLIGTLDSARTQVVMENLLQAIVETGSSIAIIDITGVPLVDTLVAQHLLKTVAAARLMGADCIISGIRPQIAQTIVHLGVDLQDVVTKATLADAFAISLRRIGLSMRRSAAGPATPHTPIE